MADNKKALRAKAKQIIHSQEDQYKIDRDLTIGKDEGDDAFPYEEAPNVRWVVIDKNSGSGYIQISGGGREARIITTGPKESGVEYEEIHEDQACMIFGRSTVLYIRPKKKK
ncbi:hypothetical protein BGZ60DRAFT_437099 [Tricladium varicosporioides]|nr:hypothetical protein BGZ60DRAFT_437099 [Hymenoscyphus varicosporioides]